LEINMAQNPWDEYQPTVAPASQGVEIPNEPEKPEKPPQTFRDATTQEKIDARVDPNMAYQINEATNQLVVVGGQTPTKPTPAADTNRLPQISTGLNAVKDLRGLADNFLSVGKQAGNISDTPIIGSLFGQNRADLEGSIEILKGIIIQDQLARLAKINPAGVAGLANTPGEQERFVSAIANLNPNQSPEQFAIGLKRAEDYLNRQLEEAGGMPTSPEEDATLKAKYPEAAEFVYDKNGELLGYYNSNDEFTLLFGNNGGNTPPSGGGGSDLGQAFYAGVGDIAQGVGEMAGIVGNPANAAVNALFGTDLSTDLGQTFREATGAPQGDPLASAINRAGVTALTGIGGASLAARTLPTLASREIAATLATQPAQQIAANIGGGAAAEVTRQQGGGVPAQIAASIAGGIPAAGAVNLGQSMMKAVPEAISTFRGVPQAASSSLADEAATIASTTRPGGGGGSGGGGGAGGAMSTSEQTIRAQRAAELPVPIELARFQRTRDFVEQQRARELAKNNEVGGPIRDRMARQQDELRQNFESFIEGTGSEVWNNPYEQGGVIADALGTLAKRERTRTNALYKRAEKSGEMREPVDYKELSDFIAGQTPTTRDKLAPVLKTVEEQLLANDPNKTGMISLNMMEDIRKLINKVASPGTPDASFGRDMRGIIDNATKDAGGDVYKQARASRTKYARDFEDIDLVQKVFATKPGSTERYVGLEKVVDKITGEGTSLDSVKHLFGLLEKAGPRGTRAMRELQGSVMEKIRDQAYRGVTTDQSGQAVIQPAALNKIITSLNKNGKLDLIFDKKTAELLNTINDVTKDIITAPPGSVNASGTSSAMMNAIDTLGTFSTTGLPIPAAKILNGLRQSMAQRGMRKEVKRLLD
jgi:hypothetical protein